MKGALDMKYFRLKEKMIVCCVLKSPYVQTKIKIGKIKESVTSIHPGVFAESRRKEEKACNRRGVSPRPKAWWWW
jgi:hypothetical protein